MENLTLAWLPGKPWPLGATWDGKGVNFAVFSANAHRIEVCLYDATGTIEKTRWTLSHFAADVWHGYLPDAQPGLVYGLRAYGPWSPSSGHRFNHNKLLLDPYAREIVGDYTWQDVHFGGIANDPNTMDERDNGSVALKARVVHDSFDWENDAPPLIAAEDTVLYELHVKGFSKQNPDVPEALRGSFAGLSHDASIAHLKALGVTSLSLLPVHYAIDELHLARLELSNYWGYNTLGFFSPSTKLASGFNDLSARDEFRTMVKSLHAAGFEVLIDVVYNHTAESDETGPTLSYRGLDNLNYYRLRVDDLSHHENHSGCGNTLDIRHPRVLQMVMDSLRYWVTDMHVDGFRFDLAPVLGRGDHGFDRLATFFSAIAQDPILSRVKLVAEPWDIGPRGYQLGEFPGGWYEWNDRFRDTMRGFWIPQGRHTHTRGDFALRLCGSADIYQHRQRSLLESVNYVVSHDGFTLRDLVSYNHRHNHANGENNRDGTANNLSNNCGSEGPTLDLAVNTMRARLQRALLATTLFAQGTPMLCAGDEFGHSQNGNNNPYCQDNATTWIDWTHIDQSLFDFTSRVISLRHQLQPLSSDWYNGLPDSDGKVDLTWVRSQGEVMEGVAWHDPGGGTLGCLVGRAGRTDRALLLLINPQAIDRQFNLPHGRWQALLDTSLSDGKSDWQGSAFFQLAAHTLVLLSAI